jgi:PAS domain S-box-containing protein
VSDPEPTTLLGGRYRTDRVLKEGPGGAAVVTTYAGTDVRDGTSVVIKTLAAGAVAGGAQARLAHEATVLQRVRGPALAPLLHVGEDRGQMFVVLPFVPGRTLHERLASGALSVREALAVAQSVIAALEEAHGLGVVHCDVKPANIIVDGDETTAVSRATLIDFGLARSEWLDPTVRGQYGGTARYMSPEQAGLLEREIDERSDLYALGVVLFECLAGRPPFRGEDVGDVLRQHLNAQPPELRSLGIAVPRALEEVVHRLLRKDPADRYQAARAVRADVEEIAHAWDGGEVDPSVVIGLRDRRRALTEPAFVGRREEILALDAELVRAGEGDAGLIVIEGEAGLGKTRLLDELGKRAASRGHRVFRGRAVGDSLPVLMAAATDDNRGALVLLDDCQDGDEEGIRLIVEWSKAAKPLPRFVTLVVAWRPEEAEGAHALRTIEASTRLVLAPLRRPDLHQMLESMAGTLPAEAVLLCEERSNGSPFMAAAILRGVVEQGALTSSREGWRVVPDILASVRSSREAGTFLAHRIDLLPAPVIHLLSVGAVLGSEFDVTTVAALTGLDVDSLRLSLEAARRRDLVWADVERVKFAFVHGKIRDALLLRLSEEARVDLHRRAARWVEEHEPEKAFDLAEHFDAGGESERALPYALTAAEGARERHSLPLAERQFRIAERGAAASIDGTTDEARFRIAMGLGEVLILRGQYDQAARRLREARALAASDLERARVEAKLGELVYKRGDVNTATRALERALRLLQRDVPKKTRALVAALLWEIVVQTLHTIFPRFFLARRALGTDDAEVDLLASRIHGRLFHSYVVGRGVTATLWTHLRSLNIAERYPTTVELGQAWATHGPAMATLGFHSRAARYIERSLTARRELDDAWGVGQSLHFRGIVSYAASRWASCVTDCREALSILERTGDRSEENSARWHLALALYRLGDLREAIEESRRLRHTAADIGDARMQAMSLTPWSLSGRIVGPVVREEVERPGKDRQTTALVLLAEAVHLLGDGHSSRAIVALEQALALVAPHRLSNPYLASLYPWLATALREELERTPAFASTRRELLWARRRTAVQRALHDASTFANDLPHALREAAWLAADQGKTRRARELLDESLEVAVTQGARYEHARTLLTRGQIGQVAGWPNAAEDEGAARAAIVALEPSSKSKLPDPSTSLRGTLSLADRFATLLDAGRSIACALSAPAVFLAVRNATEKLLRGEQVVILRGGATDDLAIVSGASTGAYSRTMAIRALRTGRCVVSRAEVVGGASDSMTHAASRSAICAPIFVRGRPEACLFVSHTLGGLFFKEEDEQIAEFIATLAGAALENADGFAKLEHAVESLSESQSLKSAILESALDCIVSMDDQGRVTEWNPAAEKAFGLARAAAMGREVSELVVPPAFRGEYKSALTQYLDVGGGPRRGDIGKRIEMPALRSDGSEFPAELAISAHHVNGKPAFTAYIRDITDRKQAVEERRAAAYVRSFIEASLDPLVTIDADGKVTDVNHATELITGHPRTRLVGADFADFFTQPEVAREGFRIAFSGAVVKDYALAIRHDTGRVTDVLYNATVYRDANGRVQGVVAAARDVTDRKRAEEELRSATLRMTALIENLQAGILVEDGQRRTVFVNQNFCRTFNLGEPASLLGSDRIAQVRLLASSPQRFAARVDQILGAQEQVFNEELSLADGRTLERDYVPIFAEENYHGHLWVYRDITERKGIERLKDEFLSIASHELRTPMTSVHGALGLLEAGIVGKLPPEAQKAVRIARTNSDRLIRLINNMLDLQKIGASKLELHTRDVAPGEVIRVSLEGIRAVADLADVRLVSDVRAPFYRLCCDADRIIQVLTNLVSNAIRYSPPGGSVIVAVDKQGTRLRFSVKDDGQGIAPEKVGKLFGKFQQLDDTGRSLGGTGLGLAISKGIVEQHGGEIGVTTAPGEGATFWFTLDAFQDRENSSASMRVVRDESRRTVLAVGHGEDQLAEVRKILSDEGYRMVVAESLATAAYMAERAVPDVILLDLPQADASTLDLIDSLRQRPETRDVPLLIIAPSEGGVTGVSTDRHPLVSCVGKPIVKHDLILALRHATRKPGAARILVVDDDPSARAILTMAFRNLGAECIEAKSGPKAILLARASQPDLIVLDVTMPDLDGFGVVDILRQERTRNTPLLVYSGRELDAKERMSLTLGETRYATKGRVPAEGLVTTARDLLHGLVADDEARS